MGQKRISVSEKQPAFPIGNGRLDGNRTRITGLKDRHPHILDDKAEKMKRVAGLAVYRPTRAHRAFGAGPHLGGPAFRKKEHTPSSLFAERLGKIGRPQDLMRALADWLGSAVKPLMEYGKRDGLGSRKRPFRHEKTHFRAEVGCGRLQFSAQRQVIPLPLKLIGSG